MKQKPVANSTYTGVLFLTEGVWCIERCYIIKIIKEISMVVFSAPTRYLNVEVQLLNKIFLRYLL